MAETENAREPGKEEEDQRERSVKRAKSSNEDLMEMEGVLNPSVLEEAPPIDGEKILEILLKENEIARAVRSYRDSLMRFNGNGGVYLDDVIGSESDSEDMDEDEGNERDYRGEAITNSKVDSRKSYGNGSRFNVLDESEDNLEEMETEEEHVVEKHDQKEGLDRAHATETVDGETMVSDSVLEYVGNDQQQDKGGNNMLHWWWLGKENVGKEHVKQKGSSGDKVMTKVNKVSKRGEKDSGNRSGTDYKFSSGNRRTLKELNEEEGKRSKDPMVSKVLSNLINSTSKGGGSKDKPPDRGKSKGVTVHENVLFYEVVSGKGEGSKTFPLLIKDLISVNDVDLMVVLETKRSGVEADETIRKIGMDGCFKRDPVGYSGGIWVLWKKEVMSVEVIKDHHQEELWEELRSISRGIVGSWMIGGDFNAYLSSDEKVGGKGFNWKSMESFNSWVEDCDLIGLGYNGVKFTWERGGLKERIHRIFANLEWSQNFQSAAVYHLFCRKSDHRPVFLKMYNAWGNVEEGIKWKVGDGRKVKFWEDVWVQNLSALKNYALKEVDGYFLRSSVKEFCRDGDWNLELLYEWLPEDIVHKIVAVCPPDDNNGEDIVVWRWNNNGEFSIKSAYLAKRGEVELDVDPLWRSIWSWKGPPKVRTFMWLMGKDRLLTNYARFRRKRTDDLMCPRCKCHSETVIHAVRYYSKVRDLCYMLVDPKYWDEFFNLNLHDWLLFNLKENLGRYGLDWKLCFGVCSRRIWLHRNALVFDGGSIFASELFWEVGVRVKEFMISGNNCALNVGNKVGKKEEILVAWQSPNDDWAKVNVDGSCKGDNLLAACGRVFRDAMRSWLWGMARNIGSCSSLEAEIWGILSGMELAWEKGFRKVIVEADSKVDIDLVLNGCLKEHYCFNIVERIRKCCSRDW
ncbi:Non-LTR retroelement reverse transcriptase [Senna tora]|uniref:Non-LTR retroelement reverse transcriptase n=1 Tax=Senna tora TaxID=362788 RepID=A0A834XFF5_9FABA|nr:Non-LTR retroelement reverse transcriptase [Senna tora]